MTSIITSIANQIHEMKRERQIRRSLYPQLVASGKISKQQADKYLELTNDIIKTLESQQVLGMYLLKHHKSFKAEHTTTANIIALIERGKD